MSKERSSFYHRKHNTAVINIHVTFWLITKSVLTLETFVINHLKGDISSFFPITNTFLRHKQFAFYRWLMFANHFRGCLERQISYIKSIGETPALRWCVFTQVWVHVCVWNYLQGPQLIPYTHPITQKHPFTHPITHSPSPFTWCTRSVFLGNLRNNVQTSIVYRLQTTYVLEKF